MIYEWEAGTHRPRAYYVLFVLVYATEGNSRHVPSSVGPSYLA